MTLVAPTHPTLPQIPASQVLFILWLCGVAVFLISVLALTLIKGRQWWHRRWVARIDVRAAAHYQRYRQEAAQHRTRWRPHGRP
jgi:hypothetical protein